MVAEVRRQIREHPGILTGEVEPDYKACIAISTRASLIEMIAPGLLVKTSLILGYFKSFIHRFRFWTKNVGWIFARSHR
jgi:Na+/H+-translocating membrane pyrophosphatase